MNLEPKEWGLSFIPGSNVLSWASDFITLNFYFLNYESSVPQVCLTE